MIEKCNKEMRKRNSGQKFLALGQRWGGASPVARPVREGPARGGGTAARPSITVGRAVRFSSCLNRRLDRIQSIRPGLQHVPALRTVLGPVVDSTHTAQFMVQGLLNPIGIVSHLA
jgi:hypothetical protein